MMPLYSYDCLECKKIFNIRHSYKEVNIKCIHCQSKKIKKNLSSVLKMAKKSHNKKEKTGDKVKEAINDGKSDLEKYKKTISQKVYTK